MIICDVQGTPPLPSEVDDDLLTDSRHRTEEGVQGGPQQATETGSHGQLPSQPKRRMSVMVGFVALTKIFELLSKCLWRHRIYLSADPTSGGSREALQSWVLQSKVELQHIMEGLPFQLRPDFNPKTGVDLPFGIQAANICITGLCLELALVRMVAHYDHIEVTDLRSMFSSISILVCPRRTTRCRDVRRSQRGACWICKSESLNFNSGSGFPLICPLGYRFTVSR